MTALAVSSWPDFSVKTLYSSGCRGQQVQAERTPGRELELLGLSQHDGITRVCGEWSCKQPEMHITDMSTLLTCNPS